MDRDVRQAYIEIRKGIQPVHRLSLKTWPGVVACISDIHSPEKLRRSEIIVEKMCGKWLEDTPPV